MENQEVLKNLTPEGVEQKNKNPEQKQDKTESSLFDINQEIIKKEENIKDTQKKINEIRNGLGLSPSNEIPPSIQQARESIEKLSKEKSGLDDFNFEIIEPILEETQEEYISRSMKSVVDEHISNDPDISNVPRLLKKAYYGKYANQSMIRFFGDKENSIKIKNLLSKLEFSDDKKFSEEKNKNTFNKLINKIWSSNRESADGDNDKKAEYYSNTNQERDFFSYGRKHDAYSYSSMMFGLPEDFIRTEEGKEYLHNQLDNKTIFLFGGGNSIKDLLKSEEFKPKKVINFDPFIKEETFDKNPNGIYESQMISASDKKIREMTEKNEIPKADEVWATYSVPFYLDSSEDIKELIINMSEVLNEGGNSRICPISVQSLEKDGENFETRKQSLVGSVKGLLDNPDYNITIFNDTLKIHKIKKEIKQ